MISILVEDTSELSSENPEKNKTCRSGRKSRREHILEQKKVPSVQAWSMGQTKLALWNNHLASPNKRRLHTASGAGQQTVLTDPWHVLDFGTALLTIFAIVSSWVGEWTFPMFQANDEQIMAECMTNSYCWWWGRTFVQGIVNLKSTCGWLACMTVFKYVKFHAGMRVYTELFTKAGKHFAILFHGFCFFGSLAYFVSNVHASWVRTPT